MKRNPQIGLGCVTFGREIDEAAAFALLDHAYSRGVRHFDTAAAYGNGASERILGKWLASQNPEGITVASKILPPYDRIDIDGSLERLGLEQLDLLYLHQWHGSAPAAGAALAKLVQSGKVKNLGASNFTREQLQAAGSRFSFVQNNHNLAVSDLSDDLRHYCTANGIAIVTYSPLGAGFLTGKHRNNVQTGSRFDVAPGHQSIYFQDVANRRLSRLEATAERTGYSQVHLALAWVLHQPGIDTVLVGGRSPAHLDQAFDALDFAELDLLVELES